ncbi:hypothetical protein [Pectobacterium sp. CHL-2024]|uniref:hypothetical protein n=1 Tax=Pectobacterium sp. CHL-2024 TaxID=3377079 RepID=UPI00382CC1A8
MSAIEEFDEWYNELPLSVQGEILRHILNNKCQVSCEGFYSGSHGVLEKGLFVAPSGNSVQNKCPICGK